MPVMCFTPVADLDEDFTDLADVTSVCLDELVASLEPSQISPITSTLLLTPDEAKAAVSDSNLMIASEAEIDSSTTPFSCTIPLSVTTFALATSESCLASMDDPFTFTSFKTFSFAFVSFLVLVDIA